MVHLIVSFHFPCIHVVTLLSNQKQHALKQEESLLDDGSKTGSANNLYHGEKTISFQDRLFFTTPTRGAGYQ
jgi:hypothetical protein